jgi:RNA polymerase sigma-70 factor (ECF subfamily)
MTKDAEQAQDLTQDIFLKVFNKLDAFQERSSFSTWLHAIVYNHCADQLRLAKRMVTTSLGTDLEDSLPEPGEAYLQEEAHQRMKWAMNTLSEDEQRILRLKYEESQSIEEIAKLYGLTTSAVKMRLKRSREKVQRLYAQHV